MFKINMRQGVYAKDATISATAAALEGALGFIRHFSDSGMLLESNWILHEDQFVMDVYDWGEGWFANPEALAKIVAPRGYVPPADRV